MIESNLLDIIQEPTIPVTRTWTGLLGAEVTSAARRMMLSCEVGPIQELGDRLVIAHLYIVLWFMLTC